MVANQPEAEYRFGSNVPPSARRRRLTIGDLLRRLTSTKNKEQVRSSRP
jgi:hypothetical protein